jgi:hypothetical protein
MMHDPVPKAPDSLHRQGEILALGRTVDEDAPQPLPPELLCKVSKSISHVSLSGCWG